jgi:AcrR family transcriptional regulator
VLAALIERVLHQVEQRLLPIVQDPAQTSLDKLQHFFAALVEWKTERKPFVLALLRVWYTDENALFRQKLREMRIKHFCPILEALLRQGREEGTLTLSYPDQTSRVILSLVEDLSDTPARVLFSETPRQDDMLLIERIVAASTEAVERVLGVKKACLHLVDAKRLREWMLPSGEPS